MRYCYEEIERCSARRFKRDDRLVLPVSFVPSVHSGLSLRGQMQSDWVRNVPAFTIYHNASVRCSWHPPLVQEVLATMRVQVPCFESPSTPYSRGELKYEQVKVNGNAFFHLFIFASAHMLACLRIVCLSEIVNCLWATTWQVVWDLALKSSLVKAVLAHCNFLFTFSSYMTTLFSTTMFRKANKHLYSARWDEFTSG